MYRCLSSTISLLTRGWPCWKIEGTLTVGGDILLQGEFPKMDQKLAALNSSIALKANQSDMDELEVTLNTKANRSDLDVALSLTGSKPML